MFKARFAPLSFWLPVAPALQAVRRIDLTLAVRPVVGRRAKITALGT
jgi:hypothetical protein